MSTSNLPHNGQPKSPKFLPLWQAYSLALFVWDVLPWTISLLARRFGWAAGLPGLWNWLGLVPVLAGTAGLMWGLSVHSRSPEGIEWELDRSYLLKGGMYSFSRNPMYLSELILLFGWVVFYGSIPVLIGLLAWGLLFNFYQIPLEERVLEARFGETYRRYKSKVRRWFGRVQN
jgi:protein-S-isoprenylcysteine O-methyltransferase Ste14